MEQAAASGAAKPRREIVARVLSAAVLIPAVIADAWAGGLWFAFLLAALGVIVSVEWTDMVHEGSRRQLVLHVIAVLAAVFLTGPDFAIIGCAVVVAAWIVSIVASGRKTFWHQVGVGYLAIPFACFALLREDAERGFDAVLWLFVLVWLADTFAYIFGRTIGGPKLAPRISPNKTWAGLGGAVFGAALAALGLAWLGGLWQGAMALLLVAVVLAVIEQAGDFFESAAKRHFGVKDSGRIIPGHGGVLDRIDGLMAVAVAATIIGVARGGVGHPGQGLLIW